MVVAALLKPELSIFGLLNACSSWLRGADRVAPIAATNPIERVSEPAVPARTAADLANHHWSRLHDIVAGAVTSAGVLHHLQQSASDRIDAAGYALDGLRAELATAMPLVLGSRSMTADVYILEPRRPVASGQALAA